MPVFAYKARDKKREEYEESGYVVASSESDAREKLARRSFGDRIHLKQLRGLKALLKRFSADVR